MASHLPGPNEHYRWTGTGGTGGGGPSGDRRFQMRIAIIGAAGAIIAAAVGAVIGLKPWSHPGSSPNGGGGGSSPANIPSGTYSTHLGRALTLTTVNGSVTIQLTRIIDPATGDNNFLKSGDRYLATEFKVSDPSTLPVGELQAFEDVTTFIGSDGRTYPVERLQTVQECTSFHDGPPQIVSGASITECVVFQIPTGVSARQVQVSIGNERGIWSNP